MRLTIDGHPVEGPPGSTILEAARSVGVPIPTVCYHETLEPIGACRVCVVEVEGARTLVPACQRRVEEGMVVRTDTERVRANRRMVVELLESSADTRLAPEIGRLASELGADPGRWASLQHEKPLPARGPKLDNELYVREPDRCILCYRCVKACGEQVQNTFAIAVAGRGYEARIDPGFDLPLPDSACVFCGNCVAVCPTEALTFRTQWEMRRDGAWDESRQRTVTTVCPYCGVGCQLQLTVQDNRIVKVTAPVDDPTTRGYLCIKGRFGWQYVHAGLQTAPEALPKAQTDARRTA
ncbi:2Fe-2S iron-sulfur cluster-binding protein [Carboxydochorda subterranea]|uniref:2Fe-2S iron-sulfur cluster-binding protein n=1 Tax=Carboxydichorda subterranea TaxID=3109565 RepID=A0ABZ1BZH1_9FIRM|nr:2Fe-2S iron-sulfur cluster-binding protein [Limnochorda sp. L945t]WRP17970.1 2Fe-2S iron-sulfur cluster-binding protein [Limnochorda sp. L945t]